MDIDDGRCLKFGVWATEFVVVVVVVVVVVEKMAQ